MKSEVNGILVAAHDLKAPLNLLRQLALSMELAPDQNARERIQAQMVSVSDRAIRQVNDLAKIARLKDGLFDTEPISIRGLCEEIYRELDPLFRYETRELERRYQNRSRLVVANRELLHSIVYNLCTNAIHYSYRDTISHLAVSDTHGCIRVSVRDFGPALPVKIWRSLRQDSFDHPASIPMRPGSSGLGLYIASQFARHMHANFGAVRHRDGTSFFIELPISKQASLF